MHEKVQLLHPEGKKLARIDKEKYDVIRKAILQALKKGPLRHKELLEAVLSHFKKNNIRFEGAVEWYMEGVKLDLEATKVITRVKDKSTLQWQLTVS